MALLVISSTQASPLGALTVSAIGQLIRSIDQIQRLQAAVANAESGYTGTAGVEFEGGIFGVEANGTPGAQGSIYAFAVGTIAQALTTFLNTAGGAIAQLDNGG